MNMQMDEAELYQVRWKGREFGPYSRETIQEKLRTGELSKFHEVRVGERWVLLRHFFNEAPLPGALTPNSRLPEKETPTDETMQRPFEPDRPADDGNARLRLPADEQRVDETGPAPQTVWIARCPQCGVTVDMQSRFCSGCGAKLQGPCAQGSAGAQPLTKAAVQYAGFWRRLAAAFLDGLLLGTIGSVLVTLTFLLLIALVGNPFGFGTTLSVRVLSAMFLIILPALTNWMYFATLESSCRQATLGKRAVGIVVTDVRGERISFGRATGRYFGKMLSSMIVMAGFVMAGFTDKKQALHDMMAGTLVVVRS